MRLPDVSQFRGDIGEVTVSLRGRLTRSRFVLVSRGFYARGRARDPCYECAGDSLARASCLYFADSTRSYGPETRVTVARSLASIFFVHFVYFVVLFTSCAHHPHCLTR